MRPSAVRELLRPWQKYRDGQIFYGFTKSGNKRWSLTTKQGNKDFYKGTRSTGVGRFTKVGRYLINWEKVRTYVVPREVFSSELKPFVCPTTANIKNHYEGYPRGPLDGGLHLRKVMEFVKYGVEDTAAMATRDDNHERG